MSKKHEIRQRMLALRQAMDAGEVQRKSAALRALLPSIPAFAAAATVLTYVSSKDNEADTHQLIGGLLEARRTVLVPISLPRGRLAWSELRALDELASGSFGVLEPKEAFRRLVHPPDTSVCLVPGIAFTPDGGRIGYGGGYYDRFLPGYGGTSIAVAFECQMVDAIPLEPHDCPMRYIVTEAAVYS